MNNIHVLKLSEYSRPEITESKREAWVEYGADNNYYQYLIDRYTNSTTNNAIINNITRLVYGKGLSAIDASRKPNEYAQMMTLFSKDCVRQMVSDLKMLGQCAVQVIYSKDRKKISKVYHVPVQLLRAEKCNEKGEIEAYYYCDNWQDLRNFTPKRIAAYGHSNEPIEIMFIRPYSVGMKYYSYVDYHGALPYAELEEDISTYLINEVNNGFSGRAVINFNNGVPSEEQQLLIKQQVLNQLTGTKGEKVIVAFNNNQDSKTTVDSMPVNDAPDLYDTLSKEALSKIMLGHNVTSPLLFGIATTTGFSSNADELQNSYILFDNMVIRPMQELLLDAIDTILGFNGVALKTYFRTLKPLEFTDLENAMTEEQAVEETGVELSSQDDKIAQALIDLGEDPKENWLLIDEAPVDYDTDEEENELLAKEPKQSLLSKIYNFVSTGDARPNIRSKQDDVIDGIKFVVRYKYVGSVVTGETREFCKQMINANKIYRKEDIQIMSNTYLGDGYTNAEGKVIGWGPKGALIFDRFLFKGGGNCHHRWNKQVYATFEGTALDITEKTKKLAQAKAAKFGYVVKNDKLVSTRPVDMPNYGFLPSNPQPKRKIVR
jgi:hypothetical protein